MKRIGLLLLMITALVSCRRAETDRFEVSTNKLSFEWQGGTQTVQIRAESSDWVWVDNNVGWINVQHTDDDHALIVVESNPGEKLRSTSVVLRYGDQQQVVQVEQMGMPKEYYFRCDADLEFDNVSRDFDLSLETNLDDWQVAAHPAWLSIKRFKDKLVLHIQANDENKSRKGDIAISANNFSKKITVTQLPKPIISITPNEIVTGYKPEKHYLKVQANRELKITSMTLTGKATVDYSWIDKETLLVETRYNNDNSPSTVLLQFYSPKHSAKLAEVRITIQANNEETEAREYLKKFYTALGGANWKNNTNWLSDKPITEWYGVEFYDNKLYAIKLPGNNLKGAIPSGLSAFQQLLFIDLKNNSLEGIIPKELSQLKRLKRADFDNNNLTGTLPNDLSNEDAVYCFRYNRLTGVVPPYFLQSDRRKKLICPQQEGYGFSNFSCND